MSHVAVMCLLGEDRERICACGEEMERESCEQCDDGYTFDGQLYDMDPLWYDPHDVAPCSLCLGAGGWWVCPNAREAVA